MTPLLSILTPAIRKRMPMIQAICDELTKQIGDKPVEHLVLIDNMRRTVGEKRDALLRASRGDYVAFVDDDDWIEPIYVEALLEAIKQKPQVITFRQKAFIDGKAGLIEFGLGNPNEPWKAGGVAKRNAWHVCAWQRSIAIMSRFPASNYGEDWAWAAPLCQIQNMSEVHIKEVLHHYRHDSKQTAAPPPIV